MSVTKTYKKQIFAAHHPVRKKGELSKKHHLPSTKSVLESSKKSVSATKRTSTDFGKLSLNFVLISGIICFFSSLIGQTMMEKARRDGIRAIERSKEMKMHVLFLRTRLDKQADVTMLDKWAVSRGFITNEVTSSVFGDKPVEKKLVKANLGHKNKDIDLVHGEE